MSTRAKLPVFEVVEEAFRYGWRKLPALLFLSLTASVLIFGPILALTFPSMMDLIAQFSALGTIESEPDPTFVMDLMVTFVPIILLLMIGSLVFYSIVVTQIIRNVTHNERLWIIKINRNTFRYLLAVIVVALLFIPIYLLAASPTIAAVVWMESSEPQNAWGLLPAIPLTVVIMVYFLSRMWLVPVDIVAQERFAIGPGFRAGRGNSARLFAVFMVMMVLLMVVSLVSQLVLFPLSLLTGASLTPETFEAVEADPAAIMELIKQLLTSPFIIAFYAISFLIQAFQMGVMYAAPAIAYRHLTGDLSDGDLQGETEVN